MIKNNYQGDSRVIFLTDEEQKELIASGISFEFNATGTCSLSIKCAGDITISCTSDKGQCDLDGWDEELKQYTQIICDDEKYSCKPPVGSGGSANFNNPDFIQQDIKKGKIKLL